MKALTKGQYEAIGRAFRASMESARELPMGQARTAVMVVTETIATGLADIFGASDPEFKRELFLSQCGVTE